MIGDVLTLLKKRLNDYFRTLSPDDTGEDKVVFVDGDQKPEYVGFKAGAISLLLYNIEQEPLMRSGDPYQRTLADGSTARVQPDIAVNLHILFAARFREYEQSLNYLAAVIQYFQANKWLDRQNAPDLPGEIDHLVVELVSLSVAQQNELWGLLRTAYLPSVAYKVKLVLFQDGAAQSSPRVETSDIKLSQIAGQAR